MAVLDGPKEIAAWGAVEPSASRVSVPIHTGDEVHGALVAAAARARTPSATRRASFLQAVANVLAIAFSRLHTEERMRHQALHDPLTGLANRALCRDRIEHALALSERAGSAAAVLFVDLDNFKRVNDLFGHAAGDALLIALAARMSAAVRPADTVARLGGDEFVVVCEDVDERTALALGWRVAAAVQEPAEAGRDPALGQHRDRVRPERRDRPRRADRPRRRRGLPRPRSAAAAASRSSTRGCGGARPIASQTENDLEGALERRELELEFQPIVSLADGATVGHEALLRWRRLGGRAIEPAEFIPVAEESGLIIPIGSWVLEHACREGAALAAERRTWISVNLSARQVAQPDLLEVVAGRAARRPGSEPSSLCLELTEAALLGVTPAIVTNLERLHELGVRLVLDDFGTGYSSFQHLKDFPIDMVKIDGSFVANLGRGEQDTAIIASVVSMASALGLGVIAEGVESEVQAELLRELGCPFAQGYYFGPPA